MPWGRLLLIATVLIATTLLTQFALNLLRAQQLALVIQQECKQNASVALCVSDLTQAAFNHPQWLACVFVVVFVVNLFFLWPLVLYFLPKLFPSLWLLVLLPSIYLQSSPLVVSLAQVSAIFMVALLVSRRRRKAISINFEKLNKN